MKAPCIRGAAAPVMTLLAILTTAGLGRAHVTLQSSQPLRTGMGYATIVLNVPNERYVDNTKVTLEVPEAFLKAGGRVNRVVYPPGWTVTLEKKDKPADIYGQEQEQRSKRDAERAAAAGAEHGSATPGLDEKEKQLMDELRKKWITKVTFEGGVIPPDGFQQFLISFQLPTEAGQYRFAAVQTYADGKEVSWSELVDGAEHPAATLNVQNQPFLSYADLTAALSALALILSAVALLKASRVRVAEAVTQQRRYASAASGGH